MGFLIAGLVFIVTFGYLTFKTYRTGRLNWFVKVPLLLIGGFMVIVGIVLLFVRPSSDSRDSKTESHVTPRSSLREHSTKKETSYSAKENRADLSSANEALQKGLTQALGWALGKLDRDGNPTNSGTPNENFKWAIYVEKIEINKDRLLTIYVTPEFKKLSDEEKQSYIHQAFGMAQGTDELHLSDREQSEGLQTEVMLAGKVIGYSTTEIGKFHFTD